jgi:hypothetical protein
MPTTIDLPAISRWIADHHRRTGEYPTASTPGGRWAEADEYLRGQGFSLAHAVLLAELRADPGVGSIGEPGIEAVTLPGDRLHRDRSGPRFFELESPGVMASLKESLPPPVETIDVRPDDPPASLACTSKVFASSVNPIDLSTATVSLECGPVDFFMRLRGLQRPSGIRVCEWEDRVAGLPRLEGRANLGDTLPGFAAGTVRLDGIEFGSAELYYHVTHREEGWPDLQLADFGPLYPDGPVPQKVSTIAECDVFCICHDGSRALLSRYRSGEAVEVGEIVG